MPRTSPSGASCRAARLPPMHPRGLDCRPRRGISAAVMVPFRKMHGLGNDFVVLDAREGSVLDARRADLPIPPARAAAIADRRFGIGCDQFILLEPGTD